MNENEIKKDSNDTPNAAPTSTPTPAKKKAAVAKKSVAKKASPVATSPLKQKTEKAQKKIDAPKAKKTAIATMPASKSKSKVTKPSPSSTKSTSTSKSANPAKAKASLDRRARWAEKSSMKQTPIWMHTKFKARLLKAAKAKDMTMSDYVRGAVEEKLKRAGL